MTLAALYAAPEALAKDAGFYIGGSVGSAKIEDKVSDIDEIEFDESDFAFKIFAGYQFNGVFALEGGYVDFGSPSNSNVEVDGSGRLAIRRVRVRLVSGHRRQDRGRL